MFKILIIDDEKPVHIAIRSLVDWTVYCASQPYSAYNGQEGLELMDNLHPNIVFLDMNMPLVTGKEFLQLASKRYPKTRYIIISGYDEFDYAHAAIKYGADDYILKPVDSEDLHAAIRKALKKIPLEEQPNEDFSSHDVILLIKEYIDRNYNKDIRINDLAEKYFFSKEYLTKMFRSQYGCPIYEYVLKKRMEKAEEYLLTSGMQIQEISDRLGYSNSNYFSKAFKHYFQMTPSEFRDTRKVKRIPLIQEPTLLE